MGYAYAKYRRPDGDEVVLPADTLTRGRYERKGFTYVGPAEHTPGLEAASVPVGEGQVNFHVSNLSPEERARFEEGGTGASALDAEQVVKLAADVVTRKISGTWTEAEAAAESVLIRNSMSEHGAFPLSTLDQPGTSAQALTGPVPTPVAVPPGATVSMTNPEGGMSAGQVAQQAGAPGTATDGAPDLSTASGGDGSTGGTTQTTVAYAGSPGVFTGPTPALKADLDRARAEPGGPWSEGQYVRVNSRDYTWNGSAWVTASVTSPAAGD